MNDKTETLGSAIDRVDSLAFGLQIPLPAEMHVEQLKKLLPEIVEELKKGFVKVTGENPWSDE